MPNRASTLVSEPRSAATRVRGRGVRRRPPKYRYIDLFAGIGGMHQAMKGLRPGLECVFASEWDEYAQRTYRANFPLTRLDGDITKISPEAIPAHDILLAGFPCQPFSIAGVTKKKSLGRAHGFDDPTQGALFFDVCKIVRAKRPRAFLLENVRNLKSHDKGRTLQVILNTLRKDLGYYVPEPAILDGRLLVPQHRERIFIVGFREKCEFEFPHIRPRHRTLGDILLRNQDVEARYTLSPKLWNYLQAYAAKHRAKGNGFGFGKVGARDVARTLSARYYKDGAEILVDQGDRNPRRLTPRECARLMGFPDSFKIPVSDTRAYRQFGNSVVVPLVRRVANRIFVALEGSNRSS